MVNKNRKLPKEKQKMEMEKIEEGKRIARLK